MELPPAINDKNADGIESSSEPSGVNDKNAGGINKPIEPAVPLDGGHSYSNTMGDETLEESRVGDSGTGEGVDADDNEVLFVAEIPAEHAQDDPPVSPNLLHSPTNTPPDSPLNSPQVQDSPSTDNYYEKTMREKMAFSGDDDDDDDDDDNPAKRRRVCKRFTKDLKDGKNKGNGKEKR